jgi:hypothetical protein
VLKILKKITDFYHLVPKNHDQGIEFNAAHIDDFLKNENGKSLSHRFNCKTQEKRLGYSKKTFSFRLKTTRKLN